MKNQIMVAQTTLISAQTTTIKMAQRSVSVCSV
jgi:hypothetical protein